MYSFLDIPIVRTVLVSPTVFNPYISYTQQLHFLPFSWNFKYKYKFRKQDIKI